MTSSPDAFVNPYRREADLVGRRAFVSWNREPASPSFGSLDRAHWGWKQRDFSDATLQYGVRLALGYAQRQGLTAVLPPLLEGWADFCAQIQERDGSFNQCYPHERTPGVVYDILSTLLLVRNSPHLQSDRARRLLDDVMTRAVTFCLRTDEKHGEIANHLAEYGYELLHWADATGHELAKRRGHEYIARTLSLFDAEGWFREYEGPDPGYQSRTLRYLVKTAQLTNDAATWDVVRQATVFLDALVMPDGTIHPMLGTRSTGLVYASPFEVMAGREARFAALAARVRDAWRDGRVPLPSSLDIDNAFRLGDDAQDAADLVADAVPAPVDLPARQDFPSAGISIRRTPDRVTYVGWRLGGVVVVYRRDAASGAWTLAHEDSGYLLRSRGAVWLSRMPGAGTLAEEGDGRIALRAQLYRSIHDELDPLRLVGLRMLNMTVLRFEWVGDLFRKVVVARLMTGRESAGVELARDVRFEGDAVRVVDTVQDRSGRHAQGTLFRCRRTVGIHMATSRYFQDEELRALPVGWLQPVEWKAGHATLDLTIGRG